MKQFGKLRNSSDHGKEMIAQNINVYVTSSQKTKKLSTIKCAHFIIRLITILL